MSISFKASHAYIYAALKSDEEMRTGEGCSTWPLNGWLGENPCYSGVSLKETNDRHEILKSLAARAMVRFERELEYYLLRKPRIDRREVPTNLPEVRQYHRLFVRALNDLERFNLGLDANLIARKGD